MKVMTYPARRNRRNKELNRLANHFAQTACRSNHSNTKAIAVNIAETEDDFRLELAAPGFSKEDFNIEIENEALTISTTVQKSKEKEGQRFLRREFAKKDFKRTFSLTDSIDTTAINAAYEAGVLVLTLPKKEEAKPVPPRKVEIK